MPSPRTDALLSLVGTVPVIPVVTIQDPGRAVDLAAALVEGGLPVVEVTLRTAGALDAIRRMAREVPKAVVAAGTVTSADHVRQAEEAGARMIVTPGTTPALAEALAASSLPSMPGCTTPSEAMALAERGFEVLKFFPAAVFGGPAWLKAIAGPLPSLRFCPTGGIDPTTAGAYLSLPNVICVGGTWITPRDALDGGDFGRIAALARDAAGLRA